MIRISALKALVLGAIVAGVAVAPAQADSVVMRYGYFELGEAIQMNPSGEYVISYETAVPRKIEGRAGEPFPVSSKAPSGVYRITPDGGRLRVWSTGGLRGRLKIMYAWAPPGMGFGPTFKFRKVMPASDVFVAVGANGHAAIAVLDVETGRVRITRAGAGGRFGRPREVFTQRRRGSVDLTSLTVDASGGATLALNDSLYFCTSGGDRKPECISKSYLRVMTATAGGRLLKSRRFRSCSAEDSLVESPDGSAVLSLTCGSGRRSYLAYSYRLPDGRFSAPRRLSPDGRHSVGAEATIRTDGRVLFAWEREWGVSKGGENGFAAVEAVSGPIGGAMTPITALTAPQRWSVMEGPFNPAPRLVRSGAGVPYLLWLSQDETMLIARVNDDLTLGAPLQLGATKSDFAEAEISAAGDGVAVRSFFDDTEYERYELISFKAP